ncbi:MauE/DoxX family redox-associated membrane protein [Anoxybacillus sp. D401a]|uniref:MauE/DoxX family redox-associated membrane protein n=1 Tax=Anoxybacillus sp. D401a TaxID=575112 RepID=UPI003D364BEC
MCQYYTGFYFLIIGLLKTFSYKYFINHLLSLKVIKNKTLNRVIGYMIPIAEIVLGVMVLIHVYDKLMLFLMLLMTTGFTVFLGIIYKRVGKNNLNCGCYGSFFHDDIGPIKITENLLLIIVILFTLLLYEFNQNEHIFHYITSLMLVLSHLVALKIRSMFAQFKDRLP